MGKKRGGKSKKGEQADGDAGGDPPEMLSEEHTIAESIASSALFSIFDGDDDPSNRNDNDDDLLLEQNAHTDRIDNAVAAANARQLRLQDALVHLDEFATEKRTVKREKQLKVIFKALTQYATGEAGQDAVWSESDHLRLACTHSLRVGTPSEQYAACRVLEAASLILGSENTAWYESIETLLRRVVMMTSKAVPVRMAALRALALTVFVGTTMQHTQELLDLCEEVAAVEYRQQATPASLRATALDCWSLLATTVPEFLIAGQDEATTGRGLLLLELLYDILVQSSSSTNMDLRVAAGECATLIHECRWSCKADDACENRSERQYQRGSWLEAVDGKYESLVYEIQQRVSELAVESSHFVSKKVKKQQRASFREFQATLVQDEPAPTTIVSVRNYMSIELQTWHDIIVLNFVRHCLQGGFQIQLLTNATIQQMLGADGVKSMTSYSLSSLEKRLHLSKTSEAAKLANQDLTKRRDKRENIKNHFLLADGEDI